MCRNTDAYREYMLRLKKTADEAGIVCNQAHAPFPSAKYDDEEFNKKMFDKIVRSMECASLLGAGIIVVHPIHGFPDGTDEFALNMDFYNRLLPYCQKFNIKVALENMWKTYTKRKHIAASACGTPEDFVRYLDALDSEWFVGCLDLGHCTLTDDEPQRAIRVLGKERIKALHVHDNDYVNDSHALPYLGLINWDETLEALAEIGYDGEFTYEADPFLREFPLEIKKEAAIFMCKVGKMMISKIEEFKN